MYQLARLGVALAAVGRDLIGHGRLALVDLEHCAELVKKGETRKGAKGKKLVECRMNSFVVLFADFKVREDALSRFATWLVGKRAPAA